MCFIKCLIIMFIFVSKPMQFCLLAFNFCFSYAMFYIFMKCYNDLAVVHHFHTCYPPSYIADLFFPLNRLLTNTGMQLSRQEQAL